jgi:DNA-binding NtrC family response regulator
MTPARVFVVDDKPNMLRLFEKILGEGYDLHTAAGGAEALAAIASDHFDVIISDLRMPGADGLEVLRAAKARSPDTEVILMTAFASVQTAVDAMKQGAYDYITKPFDPDDAALVVSRALERKRLRDEAASLRRELQEVHAFHHLVGKSPAMQDVFTLLARAAERDITVLIEGETGTGKELAARAIHYSGARKDRRFVAVNCGALPAELIESELFGHARGAFTGAQGAKAGLFEEAEGGTVFLDEIGDLPLPVQVKLNRALQEREIRRVGETRAIKVDTRVIAATHRNLRAEVAAGRFREDLFYRLNVLPVHLPPLRERREDIPLLAAHFLAKHATAQQRDVHGIDPDAIRLLTGYAWPGNARELENAIERALAITHGEHIASADLPAELRCAEEGPLPADLLVPLP